MATTTQRLTALETAQKDQKTWNVKVNDRLTKLEKLVVVPPPVVPPPVTPPPVTPPPIPPPIEPPPTPSVTTGTYGPAIGMDGIGNTQVGGPSGSPGRQVAYRFRAERNALAAFKFSVRNGPGYSGGTGGTFSFTLQSDSGGNPSGVILGGPVVHVNTGAQNYWPVIQLAAPLVTGQIFHLVCHNVDPSPSVNYPSVNNAFMHEVETPLCPKYADSDWRHLVKDSGSWYDPNIDGNGKYVPQLALYYADGSVSGLCYPYAEDHYSLPQTERFTPVASRTVTTLGLRLSGSGTATLVSGGTTIASAAFTGSGKWISVPFAASLVAGQSYDLVLSGSGTVTAMYKGSAYGNWPAGTFFADGYLVGYPNKDLPLYLR